MPSFTPLRGAKRAAVEYRRLLFINGFRQSMSRRGNCYDNAQAESFFSRFKAELVENGIFESVEDVRSEVFGYIEGYYNRIRLHSGLDYKSPLEFEKQLKSENKIRNSESFVSGKTWVLRNFGAKFEKLTQKYRKTLFSILRSFTLKNENPTSLSLIRFRSLLPRVDKLLKPYFIIDFASCTKIA